VTPILDVDTVQQALDALIAGDRDVAAAQFTPDLVFTGVGGCLAGRTTGLDAVFDRFTAIARLTHGTFGTEVEAVYTGNATHAVVITRHWASICGKPVHGAQALIATVDGCRIRTIDALSRSHSPSGIWD
jgi:ketosteroid isomerase-like protein